MKRENLEFRKVVYNGNTCVWEGIEKKKKIHKNKLKQIEDSMNNEVSKEVASFDDQI